MTAIESDVQWYIAREGKQYGPVSAVEMAKLVELHHLRPNDLVWRPGFADWRPALTVFPPEVAPPQPAPAPKPTAPGPVSSTTPAAPQGPAASKAPVTQLGEKQVAARVTPGDIKAAAATMAAQPRPQETRPAPAPSSGEAGSRSSAEPPNAKKGGGRLAIAAVVVLLLGGGGTAYYLYGGRPGSGAGTATTTPAASVASTATSAVSIEAVETRVQGVEVWQLLKRNHADWYAARMQELESLPSEQRTESGVDKLLVTEMVSLRRKHADQALAASTPKLKRMATAFLDNINELASRDPNACFSFISQGEASPAVMPGIVRPGGKVAIQAQLVAIFEAVAEGGKAPVQHDKPQKSDYDALAGELTKLGWSQTDLQLFADPKALARATPERVCKMVQDWFTAHIAISDPAVQERLLVETLRPVVSG